MGLEPARVPTEEAVEKRRKSYIKLAKQMGSVIDNRIARSLAESYEWQYCHARWDTWMVGQLQTEINKLKEEVLKHG